MNTQQRILLAYFCVSEAAKHDLRIGGHIDVALVKESPVLVFSPSELAEVERASKEIAGKSPGEPFSKAWYSTALAEGGTSRISGTAQRGTHRAICNQRPSRASFSQTSHQHRFASEASHPSDGATEGRGRPRRGSGRLGHCI